LRGQASGGAILRFDDRLAAVAWQLAVGVEELAPAT